MAGMIKPSDTPAEGILQAVQIAGDEPLLLNATSDQLVTAAGFLAKALARFADDAPPDARRFEAVGRLERAEKAIGAELRRRVFTPHAVERL